MLPRQGGFQKLFFCQQIRREGTTRGNRSKAVELSGGRPCGGHVERDLLLERVDARELSLLPEATEKGQRHPLIVEVAGKIEDMSLHGEIGLAERRPVADVDDGLMLTRSDQEPAHVDTDGQPQGPLGLHVRRGEAERPAPSGPTDDLTTDRIGAAEQPLGLREVSTLERRADLR